MSSRTQRIHSAWLLVILGIATVLRFYHLGHSSLWSDEGNTWALLSRSFAQIARDAAADIHPPGYYWLLKLWTMVFGATAVGMRSFSALLGLLLVYLVYRIGLLLQPAHAHQQRTIVALVAALLTALNPFQIYYSQEARMYMLLTVAGAGLIWSLLCFVNAMMSSKRRDIWFTLVGYVLCGVVGLWSHYSFPIVLLAAVLGYLSLLFFVASPVLGTQNTVDPRQKRSDLWSFILANGVVLMLYLPWLPTAVNRVLAWPAGGGSMSLGTGIQLAFQTLLIGPLQTLLEPRWLWLGLAMFLPLLGVAALYRQTTQSRGIAPLSIGAITTVLWWVLPIGLMFGAGLFSDAFLKFLLTASPAWMLLVAASTTVTQRPNIMSVASIVIVCGAVALAWITLPHYYTNPTIRDNYAGVAAFIAAVADPARDLVVLDAPGQQEVWAYYDPEIPIIALPKERPPDHATTVATLQNITADRRNLYALFWATDEADPERFVETWLDQHAFKGIESWQGNLRFVIYTLSDNMDCVAMPKMMQWGESIQLIARCLPPGKSPEQQIVNAGEAALVGLQWRTTVPLTARYKVTVQVLDDRNQVIAQRDSEPAGGSRPTDSWSGNEVIQDNHSIMIPIGTPPGTYRMILALYESDTGVRLPVHEAEHIVLGDITVSMPEEPLPAALIPMQHRLTHNVGLVTLIGYSAYRQGMDHAPETPLVSGDLVEFTFVWQAPSPLPAEWPEKMVATLILGDQQVTFPLAGEAYVTADWRTGQLLQYSVILPYDGTSRYPQMQIGNQQITLKALPVP